MEFRHATAHDEVQQRRPGTRCARFGEGERFKLENGGPPGEGFGHALISENFWEPVSRNCPTRSRWASTIGFK